MLTLGTAQSATAASEFYGVVPQGALTGHEYDLLQGEAGTLRLAVTWGGIEPTRGQRSWGGLDAKFAAAAWRGIRILPVLIGPGPQGTKTPPVDPKSRRAYAAFAGAFAARYGRNGNFWEGQPFPSQPIKNIQILNEPNGPVYWGARPNPRAYAKIVKAAAAKIRRADRRADVMLGGMYGTPHPNGSITSWTFLRKLYGVRGMKAAFDTVAIHPYSMNLRGIKSQIKRIRSVISQKRDRAKIRITELGWSSSRTAHLGTDAQGQAQLLTRAYKLLYRKRRAWKISGVDWFSWRDKPLPGCSFCANSGLFWANGVPKPSWNAFRQVSR